MCACEGAATSLHAVFFTPPDAQIQWLIAGIDCDYVYFDSYLCINSCKLRALIQEATGYEITFIIVIEAFPGSAAYGT